MRCISTVVVLSTLALTAQAQVVGVLEHPQCHESQARGVRPLFAKSGAEWIPLRAGVLAPQAYPAVWTPLAPQGSHAEFKTALPARMPEDSWLHARDFLLVPLSEPVLPAAPNPGQAFGGWCDPPKNKPIAVVSMGSPASRARLATSTRPSPLARLLIPFRESVDAETLCINFDDRRPVRLRVQDLVLRHDIDLPDGRRLVGVGLRRQLTECGSEIGGVQEPRWFVVDGPPRFLGAPLALVDAADIDGDGQIEFLFWFSGYNEDGYWLFDSRLEQPVRFTWKYH